MKHLRRLKNHHKKLLSSNHYKADNYLYERDTTEKIVFVNRNTKKVVTYIKNFGLFE